MLGMSFIDVCGWFHRIQEGGNIAFSLLDNVGRCKVASTVGVLFSVYCRRVSDDKYMRCAARCI
jgi:hypothetical protein